MRRSVGTAPHIFNTDPRLKENGHLHARPVYIRDRLEKTLSGPQSVSGRITDKKNLPLLPVIEPDSSDVLRTAWSLYRVVETSGSFVNIPVVFIVVSVCRTGLIRDAMLFTVDCTASHPSRPNFFFFFSRRCPLRVWQHFGEDTSLPHLENPQIV